MFSLSGSVNLSRDYSSGLRQLPCPRFLKFDFGDHYDTVRDRNYYI